MKFNAFYMLNYELFGRVACGMRHTVAYGPCGTFAMPHFAASLN